MANHADRADVEYVRILHLAAKTMEINVEAALTRLLEARARFDFAAVEALVKPRESEVPTIDIPTPALTAYDALIVGAA